MNLRRQYRNPPIREALCELRFPQTNWSFSSAGRVFDLLKSEYPAEPQQVLQGFPLPPGSPLVGVPVEFQPEARVRLTTQDGTQSVVIGPSSVSIHVAGSYPGWDRFRAVLLSALESYLSVAEPVGISRIGLRYVNAIFVGPTPVDLSEFFTNSPDLPDYPPLTMHSALMRIEASCADRPYRVIQTFAPHPSEDVDAAGFLLDIDAVREWGTPGLPVGSHAQEIEALRDFEREVFESLITDKLREQFDA